MSPQHAGDRGCIAPTGGGTDAPRIALIKLSSLGDVVHALPVAHALRAWWPRCELTWVVERREKAILGGNRDLDHVISVDTRFWRREFRRPGGLASVVDKLRGLVRGLRDGRFDIALDLQGLWKSGAITCLTRAPIRVGFAMRHCREPGSAWFTNRRVALPSAEIHVVEENLALLGALGVDGEAVRSPVFPIGTDLVAERVIARYLEAEGLKPETPLVILNPGSGGSGKRWPVEAFRQLGDDLSLRLGGRALVCWGPGEESLARAVAHGMRTAALIPPPTSITELVVLLRRSALVVGGDTGPIHVAAALGAPTLGLYGPTSGRRNGPYGPRAAWLQSPTRRMEGIGADAALRAAEALLR